MMASTIVVNPLLNVVDGGRYYSLAVGRLCGLLRQMIRPSVIKNTWK